MISSIQIGDRFIGPEHPCFIVAEMSANHGHRIEEAKALFRAAKDAGADAIKLQTYTPDTMTIDSNTEWFRVGKGTLWEGQTLYELYGKAYTPWEWHEELMIYAKELGLEFFSTPFDATAVDFLESLDVSIYKVASFENAHIPLLRKIGSTGKPVIMSTGMADLSDIDLAVKTLRQAGCTQLILLKCTSAYPAPPEEINLRTIPHLAETFNVISGLSDHTLGTAVSVAAVALGANVIEKHFIRDRSIGGPDASFSLEPHEFRQMVDAVRTTEAALGKISYKMTTKQSSSTVFRRSLFVVRDVEIGEKITNENVQVIRPGYGLEPRHYDNVLGRFFSKSLKRGTPLTWSLIQ